MKRLYSKPRMEVTEFRFAEHIAASGTTSSCYWGGTTTYTHGFSGCNTSSSTSGEGWIDSVG